MFLDKTLVFDEDKGLSGISGVTASSGYINTDSSDDYSNMWLVVKGNKGISGVGAVSGVGGFTKLTVKLETAPDSGFVSGTTLLAKDVTTSGFNANDFIVKERLPLGLNKFTRVTYTPDDAVVAGEVTAFLTDAVSTCEIAK